MADPLSDEGDPATIFERVPRPTFEEFTPIA